MLSIQDEIAAMPEGKDQLNVLGSLALLSASIFRTTFFIVWLLNFRQIVLNHPSKTCLQEASWQGT